MTDAAKPERMTEERMRWIDDPGRQLNGHPVYDELRVEARRARASEDEKTQEVECLEKWLDAAVGEWAHAVRGQIEAGERRDGYREAALRLCAELRDYWRSEVKASTVLDAIGIILGNDGWDHVVEEVEARSTALAYARAEVERLTRERDEANIARGMAETALGEVGFVLAHGHSLSRTYEHPVVRETKTMVGARDDALAMASAREAAANAAGKRAERAEQERDAARKEADRLRHGLKRLREKVKRGLALCDYLNALNELEPDDA